MPRALKYLAAFIVMPLLAQKPSTDTPTLKTAARLVLVDVVVTDHNGKVVHGLKATDFRLTEDNAPQVPRNFEEHVAGSSDQVARIQMPPGMFTNFTTTPPDNVTNILLIDRLNTDQIDQVHLHRQLVTFLKGATNGTRIGIFVLGSQLSMLQGPITDLTKLRAVMQSARTRETILKPDQLHDSFADQMENMGASPAVVASLRQFEAQTNANQLDLRVKLTLAAMNQLGRYLSGLPGRKNLVWLSGSFPLNVFPSSIQLPDNPFVTMANYESELRKTTSLLAQAQVAVYPVGAAGLRVSPVFEAENNKSYANRLHSSQPSRAAIDNSDFQATIVAENDTMNQMAESTGGRAFHDTNGLAEAVASALTDGADYYTLTYTPTNTKTDGGYRKIKLQLANSAYTLRYRRGYFASSTNVAAQTSAAMLGATSLGAPEPTEIFLKSAVFPASAGNPEEAEAAPHNLLAANVAGPFQRYTIDTIVNPTDLAFEHGDDDNVRASFDVAVLVYSAEGVLMNHLINQLHASATQQELQKDMQQGIQFHEEISVPAKGDYFLRIVVHDVATDKMGAIEVPIDSVRTLTPLHAAEK
ncbi:VWA domain-containing protein [Terriglobus sp. TAA 43]|uniref:VWA domain-containing protein n=1 Tax=Terriglobus sp. TAA 43 TaxID=278961 RepID=UPI0012EE3C2A|nr:VWA domain-containing protein [Terriglobus sp. TAA 43]